MKFEVDNVEEYKMPGFAEKRKQLKEQGLLAEGNFCKYETHEGFLHIALAKARKGQAGPPFTRLIRGDSMVSRYYKPMDVFMWANERHLDFWEQEIAEEVDESRMTNRELKKQFKLKERELKIEIARLKDRLKYGPESDLNLLGIDEILALSKPKNPKIAGIYFLIRDEKVVHLGRSENIIKDILIDEFGGKIVFDRSAFVESIPSKMVEMELLYTMKYMVG